MMDYGMSANYQILIALGSILLLGLAADAIGRYSIFPRVTLLPQAGVAIGMALVAASRFPEYRQIILPLVICTTVIFELFGPMCTRLAIKHVR
jgi:hypothetical protein